MWCGHPADPLAGKRAGRYEKASGARKAITDVMAVMIVVAPMTIISSHCFGIRFAENYPNQRFLDVGGRVQCVLHDIDFGSAPFNDQDVAVDER